MSWKSPYGYSKLCNINTHEKKLIHCMAVFTILYGNYYPPHGEFELICIGKFARRTWVNFTQQYGKNRQRCQQNKFTMLYGNYCYIFIENFPQKFSPCGTSIVHPRIFYGYPVFYTRYSEDIRRILLGLIRILIRCIFVWVKVVDEGWNFMLIFSVTCFWSGSHLLLTVETTLKE